MWSDLGVALPADEIYQKVVSGYSEPHRKYHTLQHLEECLAHFDRVRDGCVPWLWHRVLM